MEVANWNEGYETSDTRKSKKRIIWVRSNILTAGLVSGSGSLSIKSFPWNARILLDGEMKGYTPLLIQNLPVGSHALEIEKPGYQTATKTVQVPAGSIGLVVITLTPEATEE